MNKTTEAQFTNPELSEVLGRIHVGGIREGKGLGRAALLANITETQYDDRTWMKRAKCHDMPPSEFFPSDGVGVEIAQQTCADCRVKTECLEYALINGIEHGVWGGASERERRRIKRQRRQNHNEHAN